MPVAGVFSWDIVFLVQLNGEPSAGCVGHTKARAKEEKGGRDGRRDHPWGVAHLGAARRGGLCLADCARPAPQLSSVKFDRGWFDGVSG